ncbi:type II toxin-antitoxin system HicB family antitoxin [Mycolicibacterium hodleri]
MVSDRPDTIDAMKNYTYRAQWSMESGDYVGICLEFPLEETHAPTALETMAKITERVAVILAEYERDDADPPSSLTDRHYSGNFIVRTSSMLHARLMVESAEQGVSLNHWVVQKLADRGPVATTDPFF